MSSTVTIDRLDSELEEVDSTFSRPRTEFSTGVEMRSLTCSVEDPGEVVTTWICGSVTDGMSSWRKVDIDITPRIATAMHTNAMKARLDRLRAARRCIVLLGGTGLPRRRRASRIASASVFGEVTTTVSPHGTVSREPARGHTTSVGSWTDVG